MKFQVRVAGIALADDRVLLSAGAGDDFWELPGGRLEHGESIGDCLRREMREEIEADVDVGRLRFLIENFFEYRGRAFHELGFVHDMAVPDAIVGREPWEIVDGGTRIRFAWTPLASLGGDRRLLPACLAERLREPAGGFEHIVNEEGAL